MKHFDRIKIDINEDSKSFSDVISDVITDYRKLFKFLLLIFLFIGAFVLSFYIIFNCFYNRTNYIEIKESGAVVMKLDHNNNTASFLLSSNGNSIETPWIDTNISFDSNDEISFYVSGKICIGIHKIIDAALKDTIMPPYGWCGPRGIEKNNPYVTDDKQKKRQQFFISKIHNQGQIIGIISESVPPVRPHAEDIIDLSKFDHDKYIISKKGHLWLTVNDVFLDDTILNTYTYKDLGMEQENEFNFIKNNHYANVWYDDNSGFFSVNMEIKH